MRLGIGTYAYMWAIGFPGAQPARPMTALGLLDRAREHGVRVVQIGPNLPLTNLAEEEILSLAQHAREWDIELEVGTRGLTPDALRPQLRILTALGATLLRTIPELPGGAVPTRSEIVNYGSQIVPELEEVGVRLAMENGKIPAGELASALEEIGSPRIGVTLDTVNSLAIPEGWRSVVEILAPYTLCFHLKDFIVKRVWHMMGFTVGGAPAGRGQLDIPWCLDEIRKAGRSPNVILELWPPEQATLEATIELEHLWATESIAFLRRWIPC